MKYHGSKQLGGKKIAEYIQKNTNYNMLFSPFCGILGIERHLNFEICLFNDLSTDLILFLKELHNNCFTFPTEVTEEKYKELSAKIKPIEKVKLETDKSTEVDECKNGTCPIK